MDNNYADFSDYLKRTWIERKYEYINKIKPFNIGTFVKGIAEKVEVKGIVEAYEVDDYGNLSMVIKLNDNPYREDMLYVDKDDIKSFNEIKF